MQLNLDRKIMSTIDVRQQPVAVSSSDGTLMGVESRVANIREAVRNLDKLDCANYWGDGGGTCANYWGDG